MIDFIARGIAPDSAGNKLVVILDSALVHCNVETKQVSVSASVAGRYCVDKF